MLLDSFLLCSVVAQRNNYTTLSYRMEGKLYGWSDGRSKEEKERNILQWCAAVLQKGDELPKAQSLDDWKV